MDKLFSYYNWEKASKKPPIKKKSEPNHGDDPIPSNESDANLPHDFFKSYLKLWKSENMKE